MSLELGMSSAFHLPVSICLFTQMSDLIISLLVSLLAGKISLKLGGVLIPLNLVTCGSCISMMLYFLLSLLFINSRWAFWDLLRLI